MIKSETRYLRERALFRPLVAETPDPGLGLVVVVPAKDEPDLPAALSCLSRCRPPETAVEVIAVINSSEADSGEVVRRNRDIAARAQSHAVTLSRAGLRIFIVQCHGLAKKHAGAGLARKIGMDEACRRLEQVGNSSGVIASFDADCRCQPNYLSEIAALFRKQPDSQACAIRFEHPISGRDFPDANYDAIVLYELHLRYYVEAQRYAGFPFAIQTVGSAMAVRCDAYQQQNGMNKRQAGEDFYFLHKFTPLGRVAQLDTTCVMPSPRISHRVPFGTGRAVGDMLRSDAELSYRTYAPESFGDLRSFFRTVDRLWQLKAGDWQCYVDSLPASVRSFLSTRAFPDRVEEIRANTSSLGRFRSRFFRWFDAFALMKYLHGTRSEFHPDICVLQAARWLLRTAGSHQAQQVTAMDSRQLLMAFRGPGMIHSSAALANRNPSAAGDSYYNKFGKVAQDF